jgi:hypothetical protein
MNLELSQKIFGKTQISNFVKIRSVGAEFHVEGQIDGRTERYSDRETDRQT